MTTSFASVSVSSAITSKAPTVSPQPLSLPTATTDKSIRTEDASAKINISSLAILVMSVLLTQPMILPLSHVPVFQDTLSSMELVPNPTLLQLCLPLHNQSPAASTNNSSMEIAFACLDSITSKEYAPTVPLPTTTMPPLELADQLAQPTKSSILIVLPASAFQVSTTFKVTVDHAKLTQLITSILNLVLASKDMFSADQFASPKHQLLFHLLSCQ